VLGWLRRETRKGIAYGGLSSGAYVLAMAGLLDGKRAIKYLAAPHLVDML
jgi:transcriptional regulator GlxA family with amidase domain